MSDLSEQERAEATRRLQSMVPLAEREAAAGRGAPIVPVSRTLSAARGLADGGGIAIMLQDTGSGWSAELIVNTNEGVSPLRRTRGVARTRRPPKRQPCGCWQVSSH